MKLGKLTAESLSRAFLVGYCILFAMSFTLLSAPGGYVEWYVITSVCLIPSIIWGTRRHRVITAAFLVVMLAFILADHREGMRFERSLSKARAGHEQQQSPQLSRPESNTGDTRRQ